jgi:WD40 repeat protein
MAAVPLRALLALGVLVSVAASRAATQAPSAPTSRVDRHGDPLPEGAVARLGRTRFRGLCDFLHFSADGKTLVGVEGGCRVRVWDAADGRLLHMRRLGERVPRSSWVVSSACSADGRTLLIAEGRSLQMWDLPTGKRVDVRLPTGFQSISQLAVSDDRRYLLVADRGKDDLIPQGGGDDLGLLRREQRFLFWDTTTGKKLLLGSAPGFFIALALSPDGKRAALAAYRNGLRVCDTASGKMLWRTDSLDFDSMALAFSPDGRLLIAAPSGNEAQCRIWDAATGRPPRSMRGPKIGSVATFVVSADGKKLLASGTDYVLCDLRDGAVLQRWPGSNYMGKVAFALDGRSVVTCDTIVRRWDVATGKALYPDVSRLGHIAPVRRLFFTPDGKRLASVGEDNTLIVWDVPTARPVHVIPFASTRDERWEWSGDGGATSRDGWAMTPDGAVVLGVDTDLVVHRWSVREGRQLPGSELTESRRADVRPGLWGLRVRVTPEGQALALAAWPRNPESRYRPYSFSFWDAETGRLLRWGGDPGKDYQGSHVVLSPDGRLVAAGGWLYDTRTGARRQMQPGRSGPPAVGGIVVFSPDGRLLGAIGKTGHVWEAAGGPPVLDVPQAETTPFTMDSRHAAFTPDGRRFAFATPHYLMVCDLPTREVIVKRPVPDDLGGAVGWASGGVGFAPDGRTVASGCRDGTILLWDVPPPAPRKRLAEREAAALWEDLARDGPRGWAAVWRLQEDADTAVPFLRKHLPPIPKPEVSWRTLVEQLDSEQFEERETASRRLRELGRAAEYALRRALKEKPSSEQKKRIEALLAALERSPEPPSDARTLRAVAVLEGLNTPAARRVLAEWADGLPGAPLTDEAVRTRARLRWRPVAVRDPGTR